MMTIYIVEFHDYDGNDSVGYFTERKKAEACCEYLNRAKHSEYKNFDWYVVEYNFNETNYESLNKKLDDQEKIEFETRFNRERQEAIESIEKLKLKYNL